LYDTNVIQPSNLIRRSGHRCSPLVPFFGARREDRLFNGGASNCGSGIRDEESVRLSVTVRARNVAISLSKYGRPVLGIMTITGDKVNHPVLHQRLCEGLGRSSEAAQERLRGDLNQAVIFDPALDPARLVVQETVSFGVRDDRDHTSGAHPAEDFVDRRRDQQIREFHQNVGVVVDSVLGRMAEGVLNILGAEMKVASSMDIQHVGSRLL
jgi:hypothetical protein